MVQVLQLRVTMEADVPGSAIYRSIPKVVTPPCRDACAFLRVADQPFSSPLLLQKHSELSVLPSAGVTQLSGTVSNGCWGATGQKTGVRT
jgi:hypothetical protein